jgi:hypothetical protein
MIVWLASYPRSGNTFLRVILKSIFHVDTYSIYDDKSDIGSDRRTTQVVGHKPLPPGFDLQKKREEKKVYCIKTHELLDKRVDDKDKVIYLVRDGRESSLSLTKHLNIFSDSNKTIVDVVCGNTFVGMWCDHISSWEAHRRKETLLIKFEDLIEEPEMFIDKISVFLDKKPIGKKIPTFNDLNAINPKFFRSGRKNSWEDEYSDAEHTAFWIKNYSQMVKYNYTYKIPDMFNKHAKLLLKGTSIINHYAEQEKKAIIAQKNNELQEKDLVITKKNKFIGEKEAIIAQKNNELNDILRCPTRKIVQRVKLFFDFFSKIYK